MIEKPTEFSFNTRVSIDRDTVELYVNSNEDERERIEMDIANRLVREFEHEKTKLICELIMQMAGDPDA